MLAIYIPLKIVEKLEALQGALHHPATLPTQYCAKPSSNTN
jgi:hypothetical protein